MAKSQQRKKSAKTTRVGTAKRARRPAAKAAHHAAFYGHVTQPGTAARGTLSGEFAWAVQSGPSTASRLRQFLKKYEPAGGEFQDGFHRSRVRAAQFELMRLEYLSGKVAAGDRLLAQLQDVAD